MRQLTSHIVEGDSTNHKLTIEVADEPGSGGAHHCYMITGLDLVENPSAEWEIDSEEEVQILFQNGPINEVGVNGITHEALLAIVIDRLECFQDGAYASDDNACALGYLNMALERLQLRTKRRIARGVEGTHNV